MKLLFHAAGFAFNARRAFWCVACNCTPCPTGAHERALLLAAQLGVDHKTVVAVRDDLHATEEIPQAPRTTGADGKSRPATRPRLASLDFGAESGEAVSRAAKAASIARAPGLRSGAMGLRK